MVQAKFKKEQADRQKRRSSAIKSESSWHECIAVWKYRILNMSMPPSVIFTCRNINIIQKKRKVKAKINKSIFPACFLLSHLSVMSHRGCGKSTARLNVPKEEQTKVKNDFLHCKTVQLL